MYHIEVHECVAGKYLQNTIMSSRGRKGSEVREEKIGERGEDERGGGEEGRRIVSLGRGKEGRKGDEECNTLCIRGGRSYSVGYNY